MSNSIGPQDLKHSIIYEGLPQHGVLSEVYQHVTGNKDNFVREQNSPYKILQGVYFTLKNRLAADCDVQVPELPFSVMYGVLINAAKILHSSQEGKRNLGAELITIMEKVRSSDDSGKHSTLFSKASSKSISDFLEGLSSLNLDPNRRISDVDLLLAEGALREIIGALSGLTDLEHKENGSYDAQQCIEDLQTLVGAYRENIDETPYTHHLRLMKGVEGIFLDHSAYLKAQKDTLTQKQIELEELFSEKIKDFVLSEMLSVVEQSKKGTFESAELSREQFKSLLALSIHPYFSQGQHRSSTATTVLEGATSLVATAKTFFWYFLSTEGTLPGGLTAESIGTIRPCELQKVIHMRQGIGKAFLTKSLPAIADLKFPVEYPKAHKGKHEAVGLRSLQAGEIFEIRDAIFSHLTKLCATDIEDGGDSGEAFLEIVVPHLKSSRNIEELKETASAYVDFLIQPGVRCIETFQLKNFLRKELAPHNGKSSEYISALGRFFNYHIDDAESAIEFIEKLSPTAKNFPHLNHERLEILFVNTREALDQATISSPKSIQSITDFLYKDFTTLCLRVQSEVSDEVFRSCVTTSIAALLKIHANHKQRNAFLASLQSAFNDPDPVHACIMLAEKIHDQTSGLKEGRSSHLSDVASEGDEIAQILKIERDDPMIDLLLGKEGGAAWWNKKLLEFNDACKQLGVLNQWFTTKASHGSPKLCHACSLDPITFAVARLQGGSKLIEIAAVLTEEGDGNTLTRVLNTRIVPFIFESYLISDRVNDRVLSLLKSFIRAPAILERLSRVSLDEKFIASLIKRLDLILSAQDAEECLSYLLEKAREWSSKDIGGREFSSFLTTALFIPENEANEHREALSLITQQCDAVEHFFSRAKSDHRSDILDFTFEIFSSLPEYSWSSVVREINVCLENKTLDIFLHRHIVSKFFQWKCSQFDNEERSDAFSLQEFLRLISFAHPLPNDAKSKEATSKTIKVLSEVFFDQYSELKAEAGKDFLVIIDRINKEHGLLFVEFMTKFLSPLSEAYPSIVLLSRACEKFCKNLSSLPRSQYTSLWQLFGFSRKSLSTEEANDALHIMDIFNVVSEDGSLKLSSELYLDSGVRFLRSYRRHFQMIRQGESASLDVAYPYDAYRLILNTSSKFSPRCAEIFISHIAPLLALLPEKELKPICSDFINFTTLLEEEALYLFLKYIFPALHDTSGEMSEKFRSISSNVEFQTSLKFLSRALYKNQPPIAHGLSGTLHEQKIEKFIKKLPHDGVVDGCTALGAAYGLFFDRFNDDQVLTSDELFSKILFPVFKASYSVKHETGNHKKIFDELLFIQTIKDFLNLEEAIHSFKDSDPGAYSEFLFSITQTVSRVFPESPLALSYKALQESVERLSNERRLDFFSVTVPLIVSRLDNDRSIQRGNGPERVYSPEILKSATEGVDEFLRAYSGQSITLSQVSRPVIGSLRDGALALPLFFMTLSEMKKEIPDAVIERMLHPLTLHILFKRIPSIRTKDDFERIFKITRNFMCAHEALEISNSLMSSPFHRKLSTALSPGRKSRYPLLVFDAMTSLPFTPTSKFLVHVTKMFEMIERHQKPISPFLSYFTIDDKEYAESLASGALAELAEKSSDLDDESLMRCFSSLRRLSLVIPEHLRESVLQHTVSKIIRLSMSDPSELLDLFRDWLDEKGEDVVFILEECFLPLIESSSISLEGKSFKRLLDLSDQGFQFCKPLLLVNGENDIIKNFLFQSRKQNPVERLREVIEQCLKDGVITPKKIERFKDLVKYSPHWRCGAFAQASFSEVYKGYCGWSAYADLLESDDARLTFYQNTFPLIYKISYSQRMQDCFDDIADLTRSHQSTFFQDVFPSLIASGALVKGNTSSELRAFMENFLIPLLEADTLGKGALLNYALLKYGEVVQKFIVETPEDVRRAHTRTQRLFLLAGGVLLDPILDRVKFSSSQKSHSRALLPEAFDASSLLRASVRGYLFNEISLDEIPNEMIGVIVDALSSSLITNASSEKKSSNKRDMLSFEIHSPHSISFKVNPWCFDGLTISTELRALISGLFVKRSKLVKPKSIPIALFDGFYKGQRIDPCESIITPAFQCLKELTACLNLSSKEGRKDFIKTFNALIPSIAPIFLKGADVDEAGEVLLKNVSNALKRYIPNISSTLFDETLEATRVFIFNTLGVYVSPDDVLHPFFRSNQDLEISRECEVLDTLYELYYRALGINAVHGRVELDNFKAQASRWSVSKNGEKPVFDVAHIDGWLEGIAYSPKCEEVISDFFQAALPFWLKGSHVSSLRSTPKSAQRLLKLQDEYDQWVSHEYTNLICRIFNLPERKNGGARRITDEERSQNGFFNEATLKANKKQLDAMLLPANILSQKIQSFASEIDEALKHTEAIKQEKLLRLITSGGGDNAIKSVLKILFESHHDKGAYIGSFIEETLATHSVEQGRKSEIGRTIIHDSLLTAQSPLVSFSAKAKELSSEELIHCIVHLREYLRVTLPQELGISFETLKSEILPLEFDFFLKEAEALIEKLGMSSLEHEREIIFTNLNVKLMRSLLSDTKLYWPHEHSFAVALIEPDSLAIIGRVTGKIDKTNKISLRLTLISKVDRWISDSEKAYILRIVSDMLVEEGFQGEIVLEQFEEKEIKEKVKPARSSSPQSSSDTSSSGFSRFPKTSEPHGDGEQISDVPFDKQLKRLYGGTTPQQGESASPFNLPGMKLPERGD